jgi:23S rRNA (uracil1939-C5)-methyltransferase
LSRRKKTKNKGFEPLPELIDVKIEAVAAEGKCIAYHQDKVVFSEYTAPGDVVDLSIIKNKSRYMEAKLLRIKKPSEYRKEPFCKHFGVCGGCKWQHLDYKQQALAKQNQVTDQLQRIGQIQIEEVYPIVEAPETQYYRNKLEFSFTHKRWLSIEETQGTERFDRRGLGFYLPGQFDKILDIQECFLQAEPSNTIRNLIRQKAVEWDIPFYQRADHQGILRNVIVRNSSTGELMVILIVKELSDGVFALLEELKSQIKELSSLHYVINPKLNDTIHDLEVHLYHGKAYIEERMEDLFFRIGPKSFFQTNSKQALALYQVVREFAGLKGGELLYDLYSGTGTIGLFLAKSAAKVVGVEYIEMAVVDAKKNAVENGIAHADFFAGDMKSMLNEDFFRQHGYPDVVITDPPRAGMDEAVVQNLLLSRAKRIVYVSCNPATQARDLALMASQYKVRKIRPVDMFPHTSHVENVALLERYA